MSADGTTTKLPLPLGAILQGVTKGNLIFTLREDWTSPGGKPSAGRAGRVPAARLPADHEDAASVALLYAPDAHSTVDSVAAGPRRGLCLDLQQRHRQRPRLQARTGGTWSDTTLDLPKGGSTTVVTRQRLGPGRALHL